MIEPLFDRVLLVPVQTPVTSSGIYIPKEAAERSQFMTVVAIGAGVADPAFKIGDKVVVSKYAGTEVIESGKKYYVLNQYDILAISEENK